MAAQIEQRQLYLSCSHFLSLDPPREARAQLADLAEAAPAGEPVDFYGHGTLLEDFERHIAELLGKPAAVFGPSGKMLQNAALRVWADRAGQRTVALHPPSHIVADEADAYREVFGLEGLEITVREGAMTLSDDEIVEGIRQLQAALARRVATSSTA